MKQRATGISYVETNEKDLALIGDLWLKLRAHHKERIHSVFKKQFDIITFTDRKAQLLEKSRNGAMLVHLAKDTKSGKIIGYCVSTLTENKQGEVDSIFIEAEYRRCGIGDHFMKKALSWMDEHAVVRKVVAVAAGNEEVFDFYRRYDFYPRISILARVEEDK